MRGAIDGTTVGEDEILLLSDEDTGLTQDVRALASAPTPQLVSDLGDRGIEYIVLASPADGRVDTVTVTNHAVGIMTKTGIEVLIHVGIDTVNMEGKGFVRHVEANQEVSAGTPLLSFDPEAIKAAGYEDMVTVVISNPQNFRKIDHIGSSNTMIAGRPLVKIGDPLLVTRS